MEQVAENSPGEGDDSGVPPPVSLGKMLREARERIGLSVADVANQIKFAPRQIEALEADDFQHLPEMTFVRGFVRSYAKILDMDVQPLLEALPQTNAPPMPLIPVSVEVPFPDAHSVNWQNLIWLGITLLLAVMVVAFAVWHYTTPVSQPNVAQVEVPVSLPSKMEVIPASPVPETDTIEPPAPAEEVKPEPAANRPSSCAGRRRSSHRISGSCASPTHGRLLSARSNSARLWPRRFLSSGGPFTGGAVGASRSGLWPSRPWPAS